MRYIPLVVAACSVFPYEKPLLVIVHLLSATAVKSDNVAVLN
jgi:hypothetical protein